MDHRTTWSLNAKSTKAECEFSTPDAPGELSKISAIAFQIDYVFPPTTCCLSIMRINQFKSEFAIQFSAAFLCSRNNGAFILLCLLSSSTLLSCFSQSYSVNFARSMRYANWQINFTVN